MLVAEIIRESPIKVKCEIGTTNALRCQVPEGTTRQLGN